MDTINKFIRENPHIHISEQKRDRVEQTIRNLVEQGRKMLHVVADFDFTLTMHRKNGVTLPSTFGVIESNDTVMVREPRNYFLSRLFFVMIKNQEKFLWLH